MLDAALHFRLHREGVLIADDVATPVRYVIDPQTAELVFPADGAMMAAEERVLFVPEESPPEGGGFELLLSVRQVSTGAMTDRWITYHGTPRWSGFLACRIEGARFNGNVLEEVEIASLNEITGLGNQERPLLKRLNSDKARLREACKRFAHAVIPDPIAVGVDKYGVDVRAAFGVVRLDWGSSVDIERSVNDLLGAS